MGFLGQARAGFATGSCTSELVFIVFLTQWKESSNESPRASSQRVAFRVHQGIPTFDSAVTKPNDLANKTIAYLV